MIVLWRVYVFYTFGKDRWVVLIPLALLLGSFGVYPHLHLLLPQSCSLLFSSNLGRYHLLLRIQLAHRRVDGRGQLC